MRRSWLPASAPLLLAGMALAGSVVTGCSRLQSIGANPPTTTSIAPWTTTKDAAKWQPMIDLCTLANDDALADAEQLLPVDVTAVPDHLAEYYRHRAHQVDALVREFSKLAVPASVANKWTSTLAGLGDYATWARTIADKVEAKGLKVDQTPAPGLEDFRALIPYGACHDLLDVS